MNSSNRNDGYLSKTLPELGFNKYRLIFNSLTVLGVPHPAKGKKVTFSTLSETFAFNVIILPSGGHIKNFVLTAKFIKSFFRPSYVLLIVNFLKGKIIDTSNKAINKINTMAFIILMAPLLSCINVPIVVMALLILHFEHVEFSS